MKTVSEIFNRRNLLRLFFRCTMHTPNLTGVTFKLGKIGLPLMESYNAVKQCDL